MSSVSNSETEGFRVGIKRERIMEAFKNTDIIKDKSVWSGGRVLS